MTCRELADFLADYLSGALPEATRRQFDDHLRICLNCERYLTIYRETVKLGRRAFEDDDDAALPREVPEELVKAILALRRA